MPCTNATCLFTKMFPSNKANKWKHWLTSHEHWEHLLCDLLNINIHTQRDRKRERRVQYTCQQKSTFLIFFISMKLCTYASCPSYFVFRATNNIWFDHKIIIKKSFHRKFGKYKRTHAQNILETWLDYILWSASIKLILFAMMFGFRNCRIKIGWQKKMRCHAK